MSSTAKKTTKPKTPSKAAARKPKASPKKATDAKTAKEAPLSAPVKKAPAAKVAAPTVVNKPTPVVRGPEMRKKELIDTICTRAGVKKKDAKPVVESMLAVLGEALSEGRELILPPLGKVVVRKEKQLPKGKMMVVKVRQNTPNKTDEAV